MIDCLTRLPNLRLGLNPTYVKEKNDKKYFYAEYKFEHVFGNETIELFNNLGILQYVRGVQLFRSNGQVDNPIHIDGVYHTTNEGVINWVPEDTAESDWATEFYEFPVEAGNKLDNDKLLGSEIRFYKQPGQLPIQSWTSPTTEPVLMRVNVPHKIINKNDRERWCYSIRFVTSKLNYYGLKEILSLYQ